MNTPIQTPIDKETQPKVVTTRRKIDIAKFVQAHLRRYPRAMTRLAEVERKEQASMITQTTHQHD